MKPPFFLKLTALALITATAHAQTATNLLLNPTLDFHSFENLRAGISIEFKAGVIAGESINFSAPFKARPWIVCHGGLQVNLDDASASSVKFTGTGEGSYEVIGE